MTYICVNIFTQQVSACQVKTETSERKLRHKHLLHEGKQEKKTTYSGRR